MHLAASLIAGITLTHIDVNWVSDGASSDFIEVYVYQKCLLLMSRVDNSKLLRKKQSDLVRTKCLGLSDKLQTLCMGTEIFWTL